MSSLHGVGATLEIVNKWWEFLINVWLHRLYPCDSLSDSLSVSSEDSAITSLVCTQGGTEVLPPNGCIVVVHINSIVSGEAILSAENSRKILGGQGYVRTALWELTSLPRPL